MVIRKAFSVNRFLPLELLPDPSASIRFRARVQAWGFRQEYAETLRRFAAMRRNSSCSEDKMGSMPTIIALLIAVPLRQPVLFPSRRRVYDPGLSCRSEEHTSELQSLRH